MIGSFWNVKPIVSSRSDSGLRAISEGEPRLHDGFDRLCDQSGKRARHQEALLHRSIEGGGFSFPACLTRRFSNGGQSRDCLHGAFDLEQLRRRQ